MQILFVSSIDLLEFTVEPNDELLLTMTWSPREAGNVREMIQFQVEDAFRLTAILFGKAEEPPKPKKVIYDFRHFIVKILFKISLRHK